MTTTPPISIPSHKDISHFFEVANESARRRSHKIMHAQGDYHNAVYNFMLQDSYMMPHLHPGEEKIEHIHVLIGELLMLFFNDSGVITSAKHLSASGDNLVIVPSYTWHTYIMQSERVLTYETMDGVYHPDKWKQNAPWAVKEGNKESFSFFLKLQDQGASFLKQKAT